MLKIKQNLQPPAIEMAIFHDEDTLPNCSAFVVPSALLLLETAGVITRASFALASLTCVPSTYPSSVVGISGSYWTFVAQLLFVVFVTSIFFAIFISNARDVLAYRRVLLADESLARRILSLR